MKTQRSINAFCFDIFVDGKAFLLITMTVISIAPHSATGVLPTAICCAHA
jgi:hypothetical protein